ncbi:MAG TPA: methyltransferase domain-containing protein, partial [Bacteroidales bacterium]|nr:methyltransferase domain-containing protein [Bacteroidales bacterium]
MKNAEDIKKIVKDKYAGIVVQDKSSDCGCCCGDDSTINYSVFNESYEAKEGYLKDADFSLGCGLPTDFAGIQPGDHVLDLGSGAGNDCFVARSFAGEKGKITGLDFTEEMVAKANDNKKKTGFTNVEFIQGDIENMPLPDESYNVV